MDVTSILKLALLLGGAALDAVKNRQTDISVEDLRKLRLDKSLKEVYKELIEAEE